MRLKKILLAVLIAAVIVLYLAGGGEKYLDIHLYQDLFERSPLATAGLFFLVFLVAASTSLPLAGLLTVTSGVVFGVATGILISSAATVLGGTIAFCFTRFLLRDWVARRFSAQLDLVNEGVEREGAFYLFGLRMIPVIPFPLLNMLAALTSMRVHAFMLATFGGMFPVLLILVYTGSRLGAIEHFSMREAFSPGLLFALLLLAVFPFAARALVGLIRRLRASRQ